jgi:hypothetical protein
MAINVRTILILGLLAGVSVPAGAQSANRTTPNVPAQPAKGGVVATETKNAPHCCMHGQSKAAGHVKGAHQSGAEHQAPQTPAPNACSKC